MNYQRIVLLPLFLVAINCLAAVEARSQRVKLQINTDEADAVLSIVAKNIANQNITDEDWTRLFATEGYVRLKKREQSMKRRFEDADFKTFVLSDDLSKQASLLRETLDRWKTANVTRAGARALAYLPASAHITATIYPVVKPLKNSFVFDVGTDPAIFLYLDPKVTRDKFENTLAHELHHIGFGTGCPTKETQLALKALSEDAQNVLHWMGAFGEGFAMLAAAGGPEVHPHSVSLAQERAEWDKNIANFNPDRRTVEEFFLEVASGKLAEAERTRRAIAFYGVQGPWYTVGWQMAVTIEKTFGRAKLIECMCDQRQLLPTYNKALKQTPKANLTEWSEDLLKQLDHKRE